MVSRLNEFRSMAAAREEDEKTKAAQAAENEMAQLTEEHGQVMDEGRKLEIRISEIREQIKAAENKITAMNAEIEAGKTDEKLRENEDLLQEFLEISNQELAELKAQKDENIHLYSSPAIENIRALEEQRQAIVDRAGEIMGVKEPDMETIWEYVGAQREKRDLRYKAEYNGKHFVDRYLDGFAADIKTGKLDNERIAERRIKLQENLDLPELLNDPTLLNFLRESASREFEARLPSLPPELREAIRTRGELTLKIKDEEIELLQMGEIIYQQPEDLLGEEIGPFSETEAEIIKSAIEEKSMDREQLRNKLRLADFVGPVFEKIKAQAQAENKEIDAAKQRANLEMVAQKNQELNEELNQLKTAHESGHNLIKQIDSYEEAKKNLDGSNHAKNLEEIPDLIAIHQNEIVKTQAEMDKLPRNAKIPLTNIGGGIKDKAAEKRLRGEIADEQKKIEYLEARLHDAKTRLETLNAQLLQAKTELLLSESKALRENGEIALGLRSVINTRQNNNMDKQGKIAREIAQNKSVGRLWQEGKYLDLSPQEVEFAMPGERGASSLLTAMAHNAYFAIRNSAGNIEERQRHNLSREKIPAKYEFLISADGVMSSDFGGHITDNLGRNNDSWKRFGQLNSKKLQRMLASEIKKEMAQDWRDKVEIKFVE